MIEILIEIFGEFLLQAFVEVLAELGLRSLAEPLLKKPDPWLASLGYVFFGAAIGGLSLLIFPTHFVTEGNHRVLNLILTPIAVGLLMCALGAWRERRGQPKIRINRFFYGYLFALMFTLVRFWLAK
jgi:hypothetical protein